MYVRQAIDLLEGLFTGADENKELTVLHVQKLIVFAIMWSLGALLEPDDRKKVRDYIVSVSSSSSSSSSLLVYKKYVMIKENSVGRAP